MSQPRLLGRGRAFFFSLHGEPCGLFPLKGCTVALFPCSPSHHIFLRSRRLFGSRCPRTFGGRGLRAFSELRRAGRLQVCRQIPILGEYSCGQQAGAAGSCWYLLMMGTVSAPGADPILGTQRSSPEVAAACRGAKPYRRSN